MKEKWITVASGVGQGLKSLTEWLGKAFLDLAPPVMKWGAMVVIAGFASITVMTSAFFLSVDDDKEIVLGVMDRMQTMQQDARRHEIERVRAARTQVDTVLGEDAPNVELEYCYTTDWERIDMEWDGIPLTSWD